MKVSKWRCLTLQRSAYGLFWKLPSPSPEQSSTYPRTFVKDVFWTELMKCMCSWSIAAYSAKSNQIIPLLLRKGMLKIKKFGGLRFHSGLGFPIREKKLTWVFLFHWTTTYWPGFSRFIKQPPIDLGIPVSKKNHLLTWVFLFHRKAINSPGFPILLKTTNSPDFPISSI